MENILFFIAGIALGIFIKSSKKDKLLARMREKAREALTERTEERKEKILEMMKDDTDEQSELAVCRADANPSSNLIHGSISRENVENLLDVSDKTARKYLNELENENKIKQIGTTGPNVYYVLNK